MPVEPYKELPIPAWLGLECPKCGYPLRGLPEHRCSECGFAFDIDEILTHGHPRRPPEITPETRPVPDVGLTCGQCKAPLAGTSGHSCPSCGAPFDLSDVLPADDWGTVAQARLPADLIAIVTLLANEGLPFVAPHDLTGRSDLRPFTGATMLTVRVRRDYYLDALFVLYRQRQASAGETWLCPNCGERVPAGFDICWRCQYTRDGSSDAFA